MIQVSLINNLGKTWKHFDKSHVKGFAFIENHLCNEEELYKGLVEAISNDTLVSYLYTLNGNYSAVIVVKDQCYLVADKFKTYPLLYTKIDDKWLITDQAKVILDAVPEIILNEETIPTYLAVGYLHGSGTLLKDVSIVMSGTYVVVNENKTVKISYHKHIYDKKIASEEEIMKEGVSVFDNGFKRILKSIGDRPIVIPLSGGYDSRLIACLCKKFDVKNVICYTYGLNESWEVEYSRKVANELGFIWHYVEYTKEKIIGYLNSSQFEDYFLYAMNLNTLPHLQDFLAVKELTEQGVIPKDAVILPGHSGDVLGGEHIPFDLLDKQFTVAELLIKKYYGGNILRKKYSQQYHHYLERDLDSLLTKDNNSRACDLFDNWNIQNRQSNFIINSVRVYEYFGLDWRIPEWEDELSTFWLSREWKQKYNQVLYNKFMFEQYFASMNVDFYKPSSVNHSVLSTVQLPFGLKAKIKRILVKIPYFRGYYDVNGGVVYFSLFSDRLRNYKSKYLKLKKEEANALESLYCVFLIENYKK